MEAVEFRDMVYVLSVYEEKSFSRAAEKCYISQPALSKVVKKVERNLGVTVFDRGSFPLKLTPEGENIIAHFKRMQELQKELEFYCESIQMQRKSDLTIGAPSFFCTYVLPSVVSAFQIEYPDCYIKTIETNDNDLKKFLRAGVVDIGLSVESNMPSEMDSFVLGNETILLAVPGKYEANKNLQSFALSWEDIKTGRFKNEDFPCVSMREFANERFLFLKQGNDIYRRGMKMCQDSGFKPKIVMELDQLLTSYYLAAAGEGIAFIRSSIPYYTGYTDALRFYKIDHPEMKRQIHVYHNKSAELTQKQNMFIKFMKEYPFPG